MAESSGWASSPKQRSPQFEHLDSVIRTSLRLSINVSMGAKQQVSYLITARMAAKILLAPARFQHLRAASWNPAAARRLPDRYRRMAPTGRYVLTAPLNTPPQ